MHPESTNTLPKSISVKSYRKQWLVLALIAGIISIFFPTNILLKIIVIVSGLVLISSFIWLPLFNTINKSLLLLGKAIGFIMQPILAAFAYFILFCPIAFIACVFRRKQAFKETNNLVVNKEYFNNQF